MDELGIDTNASFLADAVQPLPPAMPPHAAPPPAAPPVPVAAAKPARPPPASAPRPKEKEGGIPIIIVPSGLGSQVLVNLFNVQPFLEDCAFVPWEERKNVRRERTSTRTCLTPAQAGVRKDGMVEIRRRSGRAKPLVYQVTDKPPAKKSPVRGRERCVCPRPVTCACAGLGPRRGRVCAGHRVATEGVPLQGAPGCPGTHARRL